MSFFKNKPDTFCALPFSHLSISPDGKMRICCNNNTYPQTAAKNEISVIAEDFQLGEAFNSSLHKEIRKSMLAGEQHPTCSRCWEIENGGGDSYRTSFNNLLRKKVETEILPQLKNDGSVELPKFFYIEMTFGNKCNLRCRMCNPWSSSKWLKEANELGLWPIDKHILNDLEKFSWFESDKAKKMMTDGIEFVDRLNFLGGEPLLIKEHLTLLNDCIAAGRASEISIQYNTNLTYIPENIREIWKHFKHVDLNLSCDGFGTLNEYIRFPVKWAQWQENVKKVSDWRTDVNLGLSVHSTFQSLNATRLPELYDWTWDFMGALDLPRIPFVIYVTQPTYLDPRYLPQKFKDEVTAAHNAYIKRVEAKDLSYLEKMWLSMVKGHLQTMSSANESEQQRLWTRFVDYTKKIDHSRGQNILNVLPEFSEYFSA